MTAQSRSERSLSPTVLVWNGRIERWKTQDDHDDATREAGHHLARRRASRTAEGCADPADEPSQDHAAAP